MSSCKAEGHQLNEYKTDDVGGSLFVCADCNMRWDSPPRFYADYQVHAMQERVAEALYERDADRWSFEGSWPVKRESTKDTYRVFAAQAMGLEGGDDG